MRLASSTAEEVDQVLEAGTERRRVAVVLIRVKKAMEITVLPVDAMKLTSHMTVRTPLPPQDTSGCCMTHVSIHKIVDVIAMLDRLVAAAHAVEVLMFVMDMRMRGLLLTKLGHSSWDEFLCLKEDRGSRRHA